MSAVYELVNKDNMPETIKSIVITIVKISDRVHLKFIFSLFKPIINDIVVNPPLYIIKASINWNVIRISAMSRTYFCDSHGKQKIINAAQNPRFGFYEK